MTDTTGSGQPSEAQRRRRARRLARRARRADIREEVSRRRRISPRRPRQDTLTIAVAVLAAGAGATFLFSAASGESPLQALRETLRQGRIAAAGRRPIQVPRTEQAANFQSTPTFNEAPGGRIGNTRVPIGQAGHSLRPDAAAAFRRAEEQFGQTIPLWSSSRSEAEQARLYSQDPSRYSNPRGNAHVEGRAIDVNLDALGISQELRGNNPMAWVFQSETYSRLVAALRFTGWCNFQMNTGVINSGRIPEPWHFAIGRCN